MSGSYKFGTKLPACGNFAVRHYHFLKTLLYADVQPSSSALNQHIKADALVHKMQNDQRYVEFNEVKEMRNDPSKLLIDVRGSDEFKTGRIPKSINIPFDNLAKELGPETSKEQFEKKHNRNKPDFNTYIVTSCHCGDRAVEAADILADLGYTNVRIYQGSWLNYCENILRL